VFLTDVLEKNTTHIISSTFYLGNLSIFEALVQTCQDMCIADFVFV